MKINSTAPTAAASPRTASLDGKAFAKAVDQRYWADDVGYDQLTSLAKATNVPAKSDLADAGRTIGKWAHDNGADFNLVNIDVGGKKGFAIAWQMDEVGGVELFNGKGKRVASKVSSDYPAQAGHWTIGEQSKTVAQIKAGKSPN
jgi:hypothetical protein